MSSAEFVAGWLAGAAGLALGHPFDTVKVRIQTQAGYRNILDCMVRTYRHETFRGFFKGMSFPLLSVAVVNSVTFGAYGNALLYLCNTPCRDRHSDPPSYAHVFMAGSFSGLMQAVILAPVDLIKVRLQNQNHPYGRSRVVPEEAQPRSLPGDDHGKAGARPGDGSPRWRLRWDGFMGLGHPDGCGEGPFANGRAEADRVSRRPGLRRHQRPEGGAAGLPEGAFSECRPCFPSQRRHLP
ncbi:solute carrier family 25 member 45 isoform X2 [Elgaria multicarinata webbii]|uniref:solute carrier family 25 member 45 isoform X2 n=1 Tax=Elgaria multicarinata webbii TaxID=159646 RepID=UPI002FCD0C93